MTTPSLPFVDLARASGFVGQEEPLTKCSDVLDSRNFLGSRNLRSLTLKGYRGCGKNSLVKLIGLYYCKTIYTFDSSLIKPPSLTESELTAITSGILCITNADKLNDGVMRPFLRYAWEADDKEPLQDRRLRLVFLEDYWAETNFSTHLLKFEDYHASDLVEIGLRPASTLSLDCSEKDILLILKAIRPTWSKGAWVTIEMIRKRWSSQQPGAVRSALDEVKEVGFQNWLAMHQDPVLLSAESRSKLPQVARAIPTVGALSLQTFDDEKFRDSLMNLSGTDFEKVMGGLLVSMGFQITWSSPGKDGGIDIVATSGDILTGGKFLFQCKRYQEQTKIGRPVLQEFCGAAHHDRQHPRLVFVTTSSFTAEAKDYAQKVGMRLISYEELRLLFRKQGTGTTTNLVP